MLACVAAGAAGFILYLRVSDGPILVFPGGPIRSGEPLAFEQVDWLAMDKFREIELEVARTGRSRLLWFSVHKGAPYLSCGFACENQWAKRWPHHIDLDSRVVLRVDGKRIEASLERVLEPSEDYAAARAGRSRKFGDSGEGRETIEREAAGSVVRLGRRVSKGEGGRLYRAAPRQSNAR